MATVRSEVDWDSESIVQLRVPAQVQQLAVIRAAVATVAASFDLDVDAIADARLAVDEACTELAMIAVEGTSLECRFMGEPGRLHVRSTTTAGKADVPFEQGLSWYVLRSIATGLVTGYDDVPSADIPSEDSVSADSAREDPAKAPGHRRVWIEFCIENEIHRAG